MEIDGTYGSLRITAGIDLPMSAALTVEGARDQQRLATLTPPAGYDLLPTLAGTPAHNVAHLYARIAESLSGQKSAALTFDHGVELHRALEAIVTAAKQPR